MKTSQDTQQVVSSIECAARARGLDAFVTIKPSSVAAYIADLTTELAGLARKSELGILAYLLDIAQLEAASAAQRLSLEPVMGRRQAGLSDTP